MLARRFPESAEALAFYEAVALFQKDAAPQKLLDLVAARGPDLLRDVAGEFGCPSCRETGGAKLVSYHAPELEHLELRACETCHVYLNVIRLAKAPDAVPDVDEIAALPLDVWAQEHGYRKRVRNLIGV